MPGSVDRWHGGYALDRRIYKVVLPIMVYERMHLPFISVVIPTYNRAYYLGKTIRSLFVQDYPKDRYEVIVVDNSSTDGTKELVESLQREKNSSLRYFLKEPEGPGPARSLGVQKSKGEIIAFVDSDCIADRHWLSEGSQWIRDDIGLVQGKTLPDPSVSYGVLSRSVKIEKKSHVYECCNMFYRKDVILDVGGFSRIYSDDRKDKRESYVLGGEDLDLAYRVMRQGWKSAFSEKALVYHEVTQKSVWTWFFERRYIRLPLLVKHFPELREHLFMKYFLSRSHFLFILALTGLVAMLLHPLFGLFALPYVIHYTLLPSVSWKGFPKIFRAIACFPRDTMTFVLILMGSIRHHSLLL